jgi:hypothetical protein
LSFSYEIKDNRPFIALQAIRTRARFEKWDKIALSVALEYHILLDREVRRKFIRDDIEAEILRIAEQLLKNARSEANQNKLLIALRKARIAG